MKKKIDMYYEEIFKQYEYDRELYRKKKCRISVNLENDKKHLFQKWLKERNLTAQKVLEDYINLLISYEEQQNEDKM